MAALVVALMLIPQSLAYALLAGMPPQTGLYASIAPLVVYALLGTSTALAVGPAAVTSLMTAASAGALHAVASPDYAWAVWWLALLCGLWSLALGLLRLGALAQWLSHPVLHGFVAASALLIAASQLRHLLGVQAEGTTLPQLLPALAQALPHVHGPTLAFGLGTLLGLWLARRHAAAVLRRLGWPAARAALAAKLAPVLVLAVATMISAGLDAQAHGVRVVGAIGSGLPVWTWAPAEQWRWSYIEPLLLPALLLALVGFVESVSVGQSLAARRRERLDPNAELRALGAANVASACSGGFAVTGGFARSVVNFEAGARTPLAGLWTAGVLALAAWQLTPLLHSLPQAALAATIVLAVLGLVDGPAFVRVWRYSRSDFAAMALTALLTLTVGVEAGLAGGALASVALLLWRHSRPHIAVVGRVPGTEHFRNVQRHRVQTWPELLSLRVDESLTFANARYLEDWIAAQVAAHPHVRHVVLQCSAVNDIDASALESLLTIEERLRSAGVTLHLSEVKGPVMDRLRHSELPTRLQGRIHLTHHQAVQALTAGARPGSGPQ